MTYSETVTGGVAREVYGGLTACDAYLNDAIGEGATAYRALTDDDDRKRLLISATRYLDRQRWQGAANEAGGTTLAFPRDGLTDSPADSDQLALVEQACFELVAAAAVDDSLFDLADQGSNVKSMGAGKGRMEFFAPQSASDGTAAKLPQAASDLIGKWLAGGGSGKAATVAPTSGGLSCDSAFDRCDGYRRKDPF